MKIALCSNKLFKEISLGYPVLGCQLFCTNLPSIIPLFDFSFRLRNSPTLSLLSTADIQLSPSFTHDLSYPFRVNLFDQR